MNIVYTFLKNIFIKNTNIWPEQCLAGELYKYIILLCLSNITMFMYRCHIGYIHTTYKALAQNSAKDRGPPQATTVAFIQY